mmetsp:Transcript_70831/g.195660  ORF Transcript_70831/g.195660 Transcript_70831/m.195660 type:complete len:364 (-) Transcript_70831:211-1302(-)
MMGLTPLATPLLVLLHVSPCAAQHARYRFATRRNNFGSLSAYLRWERVERGDVYLATKFFTGCSLGKFGGQIHGDGSQVLLFSMWDFDHIPGTTLGASPSCTRFSQGTGEWPYGTGAHCIIPYHFETGAEYRFELTKRVDANGTLWSLAVANGGSAHASLVGSILVQQAWTEKDCSLLEPEAESFQEYFTSGAFHTEAAWRGPFLDGEDGVAPVDVDADCGAETLDAALSASVSGGERGEPVVLFRRGLDVTSGCEQPSLWQQGWLAAEEASGGHAAGVGAVLVTLVVGFGLTGVAAACWRSHDRAKASQATVRKAPVDRQLAIKDGLRQDSMEPILEDGFSDCTDDDTASPRVGLPAERPSS